MSIFIRKREFLLLVFLFIIITLSIVIIATNKEKKTYRSKAQETISPAPEASPSAQIALLETVIESDNIKTNELLNNYEQSTHEEEKQSIVSNLESHLTQRQKDQLSLLALSPLSVYNKAFSKEIIERLNKVEKIKDKKLTEEYIDQINGTVNTTIYDDFANNRSHATSTFIPDDNQNEEINFYPTDHQTFLSGTKVALHDTVRIDEGEQVLGVSSVYAQDQEQQQQYMTTVAQSHLIAIHIQIINQSSLDTLGEQKLFVLLTCLENLNCDQLPSPKEIEQRINNEIAQFFKRDSYNAMSLVANTTDKWFKLKKEAVGDIESEQVLHSILLSLPSELVQEMLSKKYERSAIILANDRIGSKGRSTLGKGYLIKIGKQTIKSSVLVLFASLKKDYFFSTFYQTEDGDMSIFDKVLSHELIHSLGGDHAQKTNTRGNIFISIEEVKNQRKGSLEEYGNPYDIMGFPVFGLYSNAYIKKAFQWIGQNSEGKITKIDTNKPEGEYTLKKMGVAGQVAAWLPYNSEKTDDYSSEVDQFLEYRKISNGGGLLINLLAGRDSIPLVKTILFPSTLPNGDLASSYIKNEIFFDHAHGIKIKVKDIDENTDTLTFTISSCNKTLFKAIPYRAGNNQSISSTNIFENDLRGENNTNKPFTIKENFLIENTSLCFNKKYTIDATVINQGNLYLSTPQFTTLSTEEVPPSKGVDNSFTTITTINNPTLPDTNVEFTVVEQNLDKDKTSNNNKQGQPISKKLIYQFHVVPSVDEYKNDLEPHMIDIKNKDINNSAHSAISSAGKKFNHLEVNKEQILVFNSNIANNSRNPDGNKSSDFFVQWTIQDEKGNNIIPPFRQRHEGIPPKTLDNDNPAQLTWTIPQDMKAGDYKIILEVDSNNRLQEFNENNNMIFRYFSVVE